MKIWWNLESFYLEQKQKNKYFLYSLEQKQKNKYKLIIILIIYYLRE